MPTFCEMKDTCRDYNYYDCQDDHKPLNCFSKPAESPTKPPVYPSPCYAVFIRKQGEWIQQSIPMVDYNEAQFHAKSVRKLMPFVEKTRVRRISA